MDENRLSMKHTFILLFATIVAFSATAQQQATVIESVQTVKTYPFSDPNPVANPSNLFYPYFRFDGFALKANDKQWKTVTLENEYIRLTVFPEIGGKLWSAYDKTSNREFLYHNHVVKFRDIAMRGPWTSGGIEFNFGIIGHDPTTSTPIDYTTRTKIDGSVSCYIASYDLMTHTLWTVEINLPKDKAYFTTRTTWHNSSSIDQPYYQWMNAAYRATGNVQFCYPGTNYIGHDGSLHSFPFDEQGRDISWYEKNNFGPSKSYHVLGKYNDFHGAYWHDDDYGSIHHAAYDDKLGMKIFLWGLSREGGIWENLLTDTDGQYIELQSGRMFNQSATESSYSPYKQIPFEPQATDQLVEYWFPVKETRGVAKANETGALNVLRDGNYLKLYFSPLQKLETTMKLYDGDKLIRLFPLNADVLKTWKDSVPIQDAVTEGHLKVVVGDDLLVYSEVPEDNVTNRPKQIPFDFDWNSLNGLCMQGQQYMYMKDFVKAGKFLTLALEKDKYYSPALNTLASLYYREGRYDESLALCRTALSLNTYDSNANYIYGLCNMALGKKTDAKDGFSVATYTSSVRSAAYEKLAEMSLLDKDWNKAVHYAQKSLDENKRNFTASQALLVAYRKTGRTEEARVLLTSLLDEFPLYHYAWFERYLLKESSKKDFTSLIRNELPHETYIEMAEWYEAVGCMDEALELLSCAGASPIANYRAAYILHNQGNETASKDVLEKANRQSPEFVFPFRPSTMKALKWAETTSWNWKIPYYEALLNWANQNKTKALELMDSCGETGYIPFYLCRASMKNGKERLSDLLKAEQLGPSWRTGYALINYYNAAKEWKKSIEAGKKYMKLYPSNYMIGLRYATALCEIGEYKRCIVLLDKMQVLPSEGSEAGRAVFRKANLYQTMEQLAGRDYKAALQSLDASKKWPENLGVGKPYDDLIDSRLENYIESVIRTEMGEKEKAETLLQSVAKYSHPEDQFDSADLLTALSLRKIGRKAKADNLAASWLKNHSDSRMAQWCTAIYNGNSSKAAQFISGFSEQADNAPWEASSYDSDFDLIIRLFSKK